MMATFYTNIISTRDLYNNLDNPEWVVVDTRFDLANPNWGHQNYLDLHIPGAVYAHLDHDLSGKINQETGRHPLPNSDDFSSTIRGLGISNTSQVVVYDTSGGAFASRLWWLLQFYGHPHVAVLDGDFSNWNSSKLPSRSGVENNSIGRFTGTPDNERIVTTPQMELIISDPSHLIIDARAPERYAGLSEPIDSIAGHIPGAINRYHQANLSSDGHMLPAERLRNEFQKLIADIEIKRVVVYCGSGVTSCHHLLALNIAGFSGAKLYPGSWSEWIRNNNHPIASGLIA